MIQSLTNFITKPSVLGEKKKLYQCYLGVWFCPRNWRCFFIMFYYFFEKFTPWSNVLSKSSAPALVKKQTIHNIIRCWMGFRSNVSSYHCIIKGLYCLKPTISIVWWPAMLHLTLCRPTSWYIECLVLWYGDSVDNKLLTAQPGPADSWLLYFSVYWVNPHKSWVMCLSVVVFISNRNKLSCYST